MILDFQNAAPTAEQDQAARAAIGPASLYPWASLDRIATVTWVDEPAGAGLAADAHYLAYTTFESSGLAHIQLRRSLGRWGHEPELYGGLHNGLPFLIETVTHELGHIVLSTVPDPSRLSPLFYRRGRQGTGADWQPHGAAEADQILEAVVETFKDAFLPGRVRNNRTHWKLPRRNFSAFISAFTTTGDVGSGMETIFTSNPAGTPHAFYEPGDHLHLPADVDIQAIWADHLPPYPGSGATIRWRWRIQPDASPTPPDAHFFGYDLWVQDVEPTPMFSDAWWAWFADPHPVSLISPGGPLAPGDPDFSGAPVVKVASNPGDEGLREVTFPATVEAGRELHAGGSIFGAYDAPLTDSWSEVSYFTPAQIPVDPPPWPYPSPSLLSSTAGRRRYQHVSAVRHDGRSARRVSGSEAPPLRFG